jgi:hypothetical protein
VVFRHYDLYGQALAKLQRRHDRDMSDVRSMAEARLIDRELLQRLFDAIEPDLTRYPGIDAATFRASVMEFVSLPMEGRER